MLKRSLIIAAGAAAAALLASPAAAAVGSPKDFPAVTDTSFVEPSGDRAIQLTAHIAAPPHQVFEAFTTDKGFSGWAVAMAHVDLRVNGMIEASYSGTAKLGDPDNIKNAIAAYVPDRLLVIHNVQAPHDLPDANLFARTVTVIELSPEGAAGTKVVLTNLGYGAGSAYDAIYRHFAWGDAYTLDELRKHFAGASASTGAVK